MSMPVTPPVPLESGDRLSRDEFHRRYCARPDIRKAELVEGVVYVPSPTRFHSHGDPHGAIVTWLGVFAAATPGVRLAVESTVYLNDDSEVQPDALLLREAAGGAGARRTDDDYIQGAPELVAEIAASSASYDLHDKLRAYLRAGVQEYIVWEVFEGRIIWLRLRDGEYVPLQPDEHGVIHSQIFPGLRLNVARMLAGDMASVLAELERQEPGRTGD